MLSFCAIALVVFFQCHPSGLPSTRWGSDLVTPRSGEEFTFGAGDHVLKATVRVEFIGDHGMRLRVESENHLFYGDPPRRMVRPLGASTSEMRISEKDNLLLLAWMPSFIEDRDGSVTTTIRFRDVELLQQCCLVFYFEDFGADGKRDDYTLVMDLSRIIEEGREQHNLGVRRSHR